MEKDGKFLYNMVARWKAKMELEKMMEKSAKRKKRRKYGKKN